MKLLQRLSREGKIHPPRWLPNNLIYAAYTGSLAYGCAEDTSDLDVYGICMPPVKILYPHKAGVIYGFGNQGEKFDQWLEHGVHDTPNLDIGPGLHDKSKGDNKEYDFTIYSIVRFFQLCMENNPNILDVLFAPQRCIIHSTSIGNLVRENRHLFLHKGCWHKFKGYAYSQLHKMKSQTRTGKRAEQVEEHGYDLKFAYHVVRLMLEVEEILVEGNLTLDRNGGMLRAIRRGDWSLNRITSFFESKEADLESVYHNSDLPYKPNETAIKNLLIECLNIAYPDHQETKIVTPAETKLNQIKLILEK